MTSCCEIAWDTLCAELANSLCGKCSSDCDGDGTPDACEADLRGGSNGSPNGVPDDCEASADCNRNGIEDALDIASGRSADCDRDGYPDECRIAADPTLDLDRNGALDACEGYPCAAMPGSDFVSWFMLPGSARAWEDESNWLGGRPGWRSTVLDAFGTPSVMDTELHCDQRAGRLTSSRTVNLIALGASTLTFLERTEGGVDVPGRIVLFGSASLQLDPRRVAPGSRDGWLRTGSIESQNDGSTTLLSTSPYTTVFVSDHVKLEGCEAVLSGETATPRFETLANTTLEARGTVRPFSKDRALQWLIGGNLRGWRTAFDADGSLNLTKWTIGSDGVEGMTPRLEHASTATSQANLMLIWDWASLPRSDSPLINAVDAATSVKIQAAIQLDTTLAAGRTPRDGEPPSVRLVEQAINQPLQRYGLITGTPPAGHRYVQREETTHVQGFEDTRALVLRLEPDDGSDPSLQTGLQAPLQGTEVGKVAMDLDGDGRDEVVIAVRHATGPGELRAYRVVAGTLQFDGTLGKLLPEGQPIVPWDGTQGDGQALDVADFDGDGRKDLAVACDGLVPFRLYRNTGSIELGLSLAGEAAVLPAGERATCVAVIPARGWGSFAPAGGGFVGGTKSGSEGRLRSYPAGGGSPTSVQVVAGVPRTTRGGGTAGSQDSGIATGGSTKTKDANGFVAASEGFVQWTPIAGDGTLAAALVPVALADAPADLVTLAVPDTAGPSRLCVAVANIEGSSSDLTLLHGSGTTADGASGFSAIAPLSTWTGTQGACSVASVRLFQKSSVGTPDLLVTRADGRVIAVRTDADDHGSLSVGYAVPLLTMPRESLRPVVGGTFDSSSGSTRSAVIRSVRLQGFADAPDEVAVLPLEESVADLNTADLDGNGLVDFGDVTVLLLEMGPCGGCRADLDHSGIVDQSDVSLLLLSFGET